MRDCTGTLLHDLAHASSRTPDTSAALKDAQTADTGAEAATESPRPRADRVATGVSGSRTFALRSSAPGPRGRTTPTGPSPGMIALGTIHV